MLFRKTADTTTDQAYREPWFVRQSLSIRVTTREVQDLADQILALLGVRIRSGEGGGALRGMDWVQKCETRCVNRPMPRLPVTHLSAAIVAGRESS